MTCLFGHHLERGDCWPSSWESWFGDSSCNRYFHLNPLWSTDAMSYTVKQVSRLSPCDFLLAIPTSFIQLNNMEVITKIYKMAFCTKNCDDGLCKTSNHNFWCCGLHFWSNISYPHRACCGLHNFKYLIFPHCWTLKMVVYPVRVLISWETTFWGRTSY